MTVLCQTRILTGADGSVWFRAPGKTVCVTASDVGGTVVFVGVPNPYKVGDVITFTAEEGASLPPGIVQGQDYYVVSVNNPIPGAIKVSDTPGGAPVSVPIQDVSYANGNVVCVPQIPGDYQLSDIDNGADSLCTDIPNYNSPAFDPGAADYGNADVFSRFLFNVPLGPAGTGLGHVKIQQVLGIVCYVSDFSLEVTRQELDTTRLRTTFTDVNKYGNFRRTQAGYGNATGTVTVLMTAGDSHLSFEMIKAIVDRRQYDSRLRLYVNTVVDSGGDVDDTASLYLDFPCVFTSMTVTSQSEEATTAEMAFAALERPEGAL